MQATARRLSVASAASFACRRLIRVVRWLRTCRHHRPFRYKLSRRCGNNGARLFVLSLRWSSRVSRHGTCRRHSTSMSLLPWRSVCCSTCFRLLFTSRSLSRGVTHPPFPSLVSPFTCGHGSLFRSQYYSAVRRVCGWSGFASFQTCWRWLHSTRSCMFRLSGCTESQRERLDMKGTPPNSALQPTPGSAFSSAAWFTPFYPACLSFGRSPNFHRP